jgi:5-methyltetrahydropteroyltriglutamate--homocysteine methyltransferase
MSFTASCPGEDAIVPSWVRAATAMSGDRCGGNPDCGLKNRNYVEAAPALRNLIAAARRVRATLS